MYPDIHHDSCLQSKKSIQNRCRLCLFIPTRHFKMVRCALPCRSSPWVGYEVAERILRRGCALFNRFNRWPYIPLELKSENQLFFTWSYLQTTERRQEALCQLVQFAVKSIRRLVCNRTSCLNKGGGYGASNRNLHHPYRDPRQQTNTSPSLRSLIGRRRTVLDDVCTIEGIS